MNPVQASVGMTLKILEESIGDMQKAIPQRFNRTSLAQHLTTPLPDEVYGLIVTITQLACNFAYEEMLEMIKQLQKELDCVTKRHQESLRKGGYRDPDLHGQKPN